MNDERKLTPDVLRRRCDPHAFPFASTAELEPLDEIPGQQRAVAALEFGVPIQHPGYNLFVLGPAGTRRRAIVERFLEDRSPEPATLWDWCYAYNFEDPRRPKVLRLPAGTGPALRSDMEALVEDVRAALATALESDEYQTRRQMIDEEFGERQASVFETVREHAEQQDLRMSPSPAGIVFMPTSGGEPLSGEAIQQLTAKQRREIETRIEQLQAEFQRELRQMPRWQRERRDKLRDLERQVARLATGALVEELRARHQGLDDVDAFLGAVQEDLVENARALVERPEESAELAAVQLLRGGPGGDHRPLGGADGFRRRYVVNLLVDNAATQGAPIVHEENPTHANLVGRVEHIPQMGTLLTDFGLIQPGALHRANGGYLILDALELLRQPFAWTTLKRALRTRQVTTESLGEALSFIHTVSLEPEPIPLSVKVILIGEPYLYYLLSSADPEFDELFKVQVDFDDRFERTPENELAYARLIADCVRAESLRPFDREAVARNVDEAVRLAADSERLSLDMRHIFDLVREADHWAGAAGREIVSAADVERAVEQRIYRADRIRARLQEETERGTVQVATSGEAVGQINGLAVLQTGGFAFGRVSRISARVRLGSGEVVNIEREVELSGPLHSKGVLILAGFLGQRYGLENPLSLSASLVFEQSHGSIDGDSASSAELYALLSAIGGFPLRQSLAVTGAVDQHGRVQAIGGVNEKIEAFFDLCQARGLSGEQGVVIPASNAVHLMLRQDVVQAAEAGRFHVHAVETIDQGLEVLTGTKAGEPDGDGRYLEGTLNHRIFARLAELAARRRAFAAPPSGGE